MKTTKIFANLFIAWITMCSYTSFAQKSQDIINHEKVIKDYYAAYEKKDWHMLKTGVIFPDNTKK